MQKTRIISTVLLTEGSSGPAQTAVVLQDFESGVPPPEWTRVQNPGSFGHHDF